MPLFENMKEASKLLPTAVACGISYDNFLRMTFKEINDFFVIYEKKQIDELKIKAKFDYNLAYLSGIAHHLKPPSVFPKLKNAYKGLFAETEDRTWQNIKLKFTEYCEAYNEQRGRNNDT